MIFGQHEKNTLEQFEQIKAQSIRSALMADGHLGYVMPVGGVAAYDNQVSVVGVGFDIACGNAAIKTNLKLSDITHNKLTVNDIESNPYYVISDKTLNKIALQISQNISFGIGRNNLADDAPIDHPLFVDHAWNIIPNVGKYRDDLRDKARRQLGTVGSGNHYVDVFVDRQTNDIWIGVHFGSRGLGHTIASNFLAIGQGGTWGDKGREIETLLNLSTPTGSDYWALMELAGKYAYIGREWVVRKVLSILEGIELDLVHNHHNFAWKESHWVPELGGNQELVVVRKGATPAFPGQRGFVGGSMGDDSVILEGRDTNPQVNSTDTNIFYTQEGALFSTVHGSGRVMSRTEAAGKKTRSGLIKKHGKVTHVMMQEWLNKEGVILHGGGLDESPHVYRRLKDVLSSQGDTIRVLHTLKPLIVVMAKANEIDPYKD